MVTPAAITAQTAAITAARRARPRGHAEGGIACAVAGGAAEVAEGSVISMRKDRHRRRCQWTGANSTAPTTGH
jgi:hypothetical protein